MKHTHTHTHTCSSRPHKYPLSRQTNIITQNAAIARKVSLQCALRKPNVGKLSALLSVSSGRIYCKHKHCRFPQETERRQVVCLYNNTFLHNNNPFTNQYIYIYIPLLCGHGMFESLTLQCRRTCLRESFLSPLRRMTKSINQSINACAQKPHMRLCSEHVFKSITCACAQSMCSKASRAHARISNMH